MFSRPQFNQLLLVVSWRFVILPEFIDVDVADWNDENVAAEYDDKENSAILQNF